MAKFRDVIPDIANLVLKSLQDAASFYDFDKDDILSAARDIPPPKSGIYFFTKDGEIIYIGQSVSVYNRMRSHSSFVDEWYQDQMRIAFLEVPVEELDLIEAFYIRLFRPSGNRRRTGNWKGSNSSLQCHLLSRLQNAIGEAGWERIVNILDKLPEDK